MVGLARITTQQRLEWSDTDASGHHHYGAMLRMAAAAEAELLERLGLLDELYGRLPRVQISLNLRKPVRFRARLEVELEVLELGRTSVVFRFSIRAEGATVADGRIAAVRVGRSGRPTAWNARQRRKLLASGDLTGRGAD